MNKEGKPSLFVFMRKIFFVLTITLLFISPKISYGVSSARPALLATDRAELEKQLGDLESQIDAQKVILDAKRKESASLQRDISILTAQIKQAKLAIKARDLVIEQLTDDISGKNETIGQLSSKINREKESLSQLLRNTQQLDDYSLPDFVLGSKSLSDFYLDVDTYQSIKQGLGDSMDIISGTKKQTEDEKAVLEDKKSEQIDLRRIQVLQQQKIQQQEKEKNNLLKITKGLENEYQKILKDKEASAAKIRSALFSLEGSQAIQFGDAVRYANEVYNNLGVRPAFLLGIIAEESNLGQNVGTGNWKTDMHPTRDVPVFQQITSELGLNPDKMPVSKKAWYGWGGAMGPAQVIPSTWILFKDRLAKISGSNPPNPWNARDALFAAGLILKDNGASDGTRAAERLAALRYLAGWKNATKKAYAFYGDDVMDLADKYQSQINILNK